jgi:hypothetical protein
MQTAPRAALAALVLAAAALAGAGPQPAAPLAGTDGPVSAPREARIRIGMRTYIVTAQLRRMLIATDQTIPAGNTDPLQVFVTLVPADGQRADPFTDPQVILRGPGVTTTTRLLDTPTIALVPQIGRDWSAFHNTILRTESPHAMLTFKSRGKTHSVTFNSLAIQPPFATGE